MAAIRYLLSVCLVAVMCAIVSAQIVAKYEALKYVSHSNLDFANALYRVMSRKEGNLFFSPISIHTILSMTSIGARGATALEMRVGLYLPEEERTTLDGFRHLMTALEENRHVTTKIANRIFTDVRFPPTDDFMRSTTADFHSYSQVVDFEHKFEEARGKINAWVENTTEHKIVNLLPGGSIDSSTAMVLVNAIYFKGPWDTVFYEQRTTPKPFYVSEGVTKEVPMMQQFVTGDYAYFDSQTLNAEVLEIPYSGKKVSMIIILPKEKNGLRDVETRLAGLKMSRITSSHVSYPHIHLSMPKFRLEESTDLKEDLIQMGMSNMFSDQADFSGLAPGPISISKVVHKAFIEVNENGTEAAAATAVPLMTRRQPRVDRSFTVDHPFIFMLVSSELNENDQSKLRSVLFMGRFSQPN